MMSLRKSLGFCRRGAAMVAILFSGNIIVKHIFHTSIKHVYIQKRAFLYDYNFLWWMAGYVRNRTAICIHN